ncbi:MAG TPA: YciI family protein [Anaeromyxobacteraceae bacterium]|nr:YciI family protein [Anaeromyxobacteraceae bacterium]
MANFMLIFRGGNSSGDSPEQMQQHMQKWFTWFEGLTKSGVYKGQGAPLETGGKVIRGSRKAVSDGPFAETKDLVGGYAIVEAKDLDAAVEIARGCPTYEKDGAVEVRPVRAM